MVTTDVRRDLIASLQQRGVRVRTWHELVRAMEGVFGVTPFTKIGGIEFGMKAGGTGRIVAEIVDGQLEVREL